MLKSNSISHRHDRPVWSEPALSIWIRRDLPANAPDFVIKLEDDFGSAFFEGASRGAPLYLKVYSQLSNGPRLSAEQVASIVRGNSVEADFQSTKGELLSYRAHLAASEIQKIPWKSQPEKYDSLLRIGRAFPMVKKEGGENKQWGWEIDQTVFPRRIKHGNDVFPFEPSHAFQCLKLGYCRLQAYRVVYAGAVQKDATSLPSAKLHVSLLRSESIFLPSTQSNTFSYE